MAPEKEGSAGADLRELLARVENRTQVASRRYYRAWDEAKDPGKALPSAGAAETYLEIDAEVRGALQRDSLAVVMLFKARTAAIYPFDQRL